MVEFIRCFIALDLPDGMVKGLEDIQNELKQKELFTGKLTEKENLHLTLKFLGELPEEKIKRAQDRLKKVSKKSFTAVIDELGVFSEDFIKIVWAKLEGKDVFELQASIDDALSDLFAKENRFMSHITIVRVKQVKDKKALIEFLKNYKLNVKGTVSSFSLIKSTLTPSGPVYEVIERYPLSL